MTANPWLWRIAIVCLLIFAMPAAARAQDEDQRLQSFLERLGLTDLQAAHLEEQLEKLPSGAGRTELARRLGDLYAQQLTDSVGDADRYELLSQRVERLMKQVPEARTAALEVMLLQVDYQRAESLIRTWLAEPAGQAAAREAREILERITPQLNTQSEQLWKLVEEQTAVVDAARSDVEAAERELVRRQSIAARAAYYTGWSYYYRGILPGPTSRDQDVQAARAWFHKLLGITTEDKYTELDAESLSLESPWRARAFVGLAMSEAALRKVSDALACFSILQSDITAAEVHDQIDYWCVQGLLLAGYDNEALAYARERIVLLPEEPSEGRISFCAALIAAGQRDSSEPEVSKQLSNLGMRGLARMRQYRLLYELLAKFNIAVENPEGFLLLWLQGQQRLDTAQSSQKAEEFEAAAASLRAALAAKDASADLAALSYCRQQLAWCYYNLEQYVEAIEVYREAADGLKAVGDSGAVEAGWMSFVSANQLVEEGGGNPTVLHDAANWLNQQFPGHDHARRAMFIASKLRLRNASPEERLQALKNIKPDDPNFSTARQEICGALYQLWREASSDQKPAVAEQLNEAIAETLSPQSLTRVESADQLLVRLMAIDLALASAPLNQANAEQHFSAAEGLVGRSGVSDDAVAEYHYRAIQIARLSNDTEAILQHGRWYLDHGRESRFESSALIAVAKVLEDIAKDDGQRTTEFAEPSFHIYKRLTELLGTDREVISSNKNAQVALSRLAHYANQLGQHVEAARALKQLLAAFPKDRGYLQRAGLIHFELKQFQESLECWRTVAAGSRAGTEPWYEAKYYQIACLLEVDRDAATAVFNQLKLLDPDLGPPEWREKFKDLQSRL